MVTCGILELIYLTYENEACVSITEYPDSYILTPIAS